MWKIKVLIQFVLSKLPAGEKANYVLQKLYKKMTDEDRAKRRIIHLFKDFMKIDKHFPLEGSTVVEIGTGWNAFCAVCLYLVGVRHCHTYDHVRHVRYRLVQMLVGYIEDLLDEISQITCIPLDVLETRLSKLKNSRSLDDFLSRANITYYAPGDATQTGLKSGSVDVVFSNKVLEYMPKEAIYDLTNESKRVLKEDGVAYHSIGLQDDYSGFDRKINKFNHLRYSEALWSLFVHNRIAYRNRLREKQFLDIFRDCGAKIVWEETKTEKDGIDILKNMKIDKCFRGMTYEQLSIYAIKIILSFSTLHLT